MIHNHLKCTWNYKCIIPASSLRCYSDDYEQCPYFMNNNSRQGLQDKSSHTLDLSLPTDTSSDEIIETLEDELNG